MAADGCQFTTLAETVLGAHLVTSPAADDDSERTGVAPNSGENAPGVGRESPVVEWVITPAKTDSNSPLSLFFWSN